MIGTTDWAKRWLAPFCIAGLGVGAIVGALLYRFADVPELVAAKPAITVTATATVPAPPVTLTETPAPVTNLVTVTRAAAPVTETVVKTSQIAPKTLTEAAGTPEPETVTVTATETEEVMNVGRSKSAGEDDG